MAAEFVGLTVIVTLKSSQSAQIKGLVQDIRAGQLLLSNGEIYSLLCFKSTHSAS